MSCTTTASGSAAASISAARARINGCRMPSRRRRVSWSANTIAPSAGRSRVPSSVRTVSPNSCTTAASPGVPGSTTSRASWSASTITAPSSVRITATVLLPEATPPVSPTRIRAVCQPRWSGPAARAPGGRASGGRAPAPGGRAPTPGGRACRDQPRTQFGAIRRFSWPSDLRFAQNRGTSGRGLDGLDHPGPSMVSTGSTTRALVSTSSTPRARPAGPHHHPGDVRVWCDDRRMTLTQYFVASTLDGFIADPDDDLGWLLQFDASYDPEGVGDANPYEEFIEDVSVIAMGSTTYEWVQRHDPEGWPYEDRPTYVFTHRSLEPIAGANLLFTSDPVADVHTEMREKAGEGNIWLVGGGDLVGQFLDHGLLDEIWLTLAPVTLGAGAPVLPRRHTDPMRLVSSVASPNGTFAHLRYRVAR